MWLKVCDINVDELEPGVYWARLFKKVKLAVIDVRECYDNKGNLVDPYWLNFIENEVIEILLIDEPK